MQHHQRAHHYSLHEARPVVIFEPLIKPLLLYELVTWCVTLDYNWSQESKCQVMKQVAPGVSNETLARQGGPFALLACCHVEAFKGDDDKVGAIGAMQRPEDNNTPSQ